MLHSDLNSFQQLELQQAVHGVESGHGRSVNRGPQGSALTGIEYGRYVDRLAA